MTNKSEAAKILREADKRSFKWSDGTTEHIELILGTFDDKVDDIVETMKKKILGDGNTILNSDGSKEFIRTDVIHDITKEGSEAFIWNASGEKVKHSRTHIVLHEDGTEDTESMRAVFRIF